MNFSNQFSETLCEVCKLFPETQSHILQCPEMAPKLKLISLDNKMDECFVYGNVDEQLKNSKIYCEIMDLRKEILDEKKTEENSKYFNLNFISDWPVHVCLV